MVSSSGRSEVDWNVDGVVVPVDLWIEHDTIGLNAPKPRGRIRTRKNSK